MMDPIAHASRQKRSKWIRHVPRHRVDRHAARAYAPPNHPEVPRDDNRPCRAPAALRRCSNRARPQQIDDLLGQREGRMPVSTWFARGSRTPRAIRSISARSVMPSAAELPLDDTSPNPQWKTPVGDRVADRRRERS
jgi:hypothetical protein